MRISTKSLLLTIIVVWLANNGCKDNNTIVPTDQRNNTYLWNYDTLFFTNGTSDGQTLINDIYGFNDSLVFAVGHDAWGGSGGYWKYDGHFWKREKVFKYEGGFESQAIGFEFIIGFNTNDYYLVGSNIYTNPAPPPNFNIRGVLWHYFQNSWKKIDLNINSDIKNAFTVSNSIRFVTTGKYIVFTGDMPIKDSVSLIVNNKIYSDAFISYAFIDDKNNLFSSVQYSDSLGRIDNYLLRKENNTWIVIDSIVDYRSQSGATWGSAGFWKSLSGVVYSFGYGGIYRFSNGAWSVIYRDELIVDLFGTDENNIAAVTSTNDVIIYNGETWHKIFNPNNTTLHFGKIWMSEKSIMLAFNDGTKSYLCRGIKQ